MTDPGRETGPVRGEPRRPPGPGIGSPVLITAISAVVFAGATIALLRGELSTALAELASGVALLAFGATVYGILQIVLRLIESAGERRRVAREVSERRWADRASKPPGSPG